MTKKLKEISREKYLTFLDLGIPAVAFGPLPPSRKDMFRTLLDVSDNPHRIENEKEWTTREGSSFVLYPGKFRFFTLVDSDES